MRHYNTYEMKALEEIHEWEKSGRGALAATMDIIGKPVELLFRSVPAPLKAAIGSSIMGFMEMLKDLSYWSYSDRAILKAARSVGLAASAVPELAGRDLESLDRIARRFFNSNKMMAALEGAGCGLGGLALIAADIPALFAISFRAIQQIGASYGFDMRDPAMFPVIMRIFMTGSGSSAAIKSSAMVELHAAARSIARDTAIKKISGKANGWAVSELIGRGSESLSLHIAESVSKRKMSQVLPLIGAAVGAGFNYWFMGNIAVSSYMIFRKIHLERYCSAAPDTPVRTTALRIPIRQVLRNAFR